MSITTQDPIATTPEPQNGPSSKPFAAAKRLRSTAGSAGTGLALLAAAAGAVLLATRRGSASRDARIRAPAGHTADKTLASASPALFGATPRREFYIGRDLARAASVEDLRAMAHRRLPRFALEYLEGGSEDEATLARNLEALAEWRFAHRSLVDVSRRDLSSNLFGRRMAMPVVVAPTGLNALFWPHADLRLAEAAADAGIPFVQSTMSNDAMADIASVPRLRHWWQLYVFGSTAVREALIERARDRGCEALVVTVDAQLYGNREWEKRDQADSKHLSWSAKFDVLRHPRWLISGIASHGMPRFDNVVEFIPRDRRGFFDSAYWIRSQMDRGLSWDTVARIRDRWPGKLVIKGLLNVGDVIRAADIGADAVALSNHGGRQLDWAVSPLDILQSARQAVGSRIGILVDGGIRRGTDVIKAIALGADAVLIGRAALYGVAAAGRKGAKRSLDILRDEIDRDLGLVGAPSMAALGPQMLVRSVSSSPIGRPS
jgi:(S)-mandelate dehydrogenase